MTINYTDKVRDAISRHVPGHNDGIIATEILDMFLPVPLPDTAAVDVWDVEGVTFRRAKEEAINAALRATGYAEELAAEKPQRGFGLSIEASQLMGRVNAFALLSRAWSAVADVIDTHEVRERDAKEDAELEERLQHVH